jgi:chaperonin GroES|tara:strand:- start:249 stop:530 length:282 start_codon:yes stop_codon:yes gene_type:complete
MKELKITPIGDRIVLKPDVIKETTDSGILIASQHQEVQTRGVVVAVGKKAEHVSKGDYVMFAHHVATKFLFDNEEFFIFRELDVMAIINKEDK